MSVKFCLVCQVCHNHTCTNRTAASYGRCGGKPPKICQTNQTHHQLNLQLTRALKDLPLRIQTGSVKQRHEIIENVIGVLENPGREKMILREKIYILWALCFIGINDNIVKGICKVVGLTLHRYRDLKSQQFVKELIEKLLDKQGEWSVKHLTGVLAEIAVQQKNVVAT